MVSKDLPFSIHRLDRRGRKDDEGPVRCGKSKAAFHYFWYDTNASYAADRKEEALINHNICPT